MRVQVLDEATGDLADGYRFYERQAGGLGEYFLHSLWSDINSLCQYGGVHAVHYGYHRMLSGPGMTKVWNLVVDPDCLDTDIVSLRKLREAMDQAVLDAYGWGELDPSDRDGIVKRLRALNRERAEEERRQAGGKG